MRLILAFLIIFISCNSIEIKKTPIEDSLGGRTEAEIKDSLRGVIDKEVNEKVYGVDSASIQNSPVKILSAKPIEKEYSNYKDIRLTWKNVSNKKISAIKFRWKGINAFGEDADMDIGSGGYGSGFSVIIAI